MKTLLFQSPLTQLNCPYPAVLQLSGFLCANNIDCLGIDLSIEFINEIFLPQNLERIFIKGEKSKKLDKNCAKILKESTNYLKTISAVFSFLQGKNTTLATRICSKNFLPQSVQKIKEEDLAFNFGEGSNYDCAKFLCTNYLKDLTEFINKVDNPYFELIRYGEKISSFAPVFDPLEEVLQGKSNSIIDDILVEIVQRKIEKENPNLIGFSIPFPGNLLPALISAKFIKQKFPHIKIVFGGGFINTELRNISCNKIFQYIDFICFDDGEIPLLRLINYLQNKEKKEHLLRTICCNEKGELQKINLDSCENLPFEQIPAPNFSQIDKNLYLHLIDNPNKMMQLWSNGFWNKMQLAHGCYWKKCAFCDTSLDYIARFEKQSAKIIVDKIESIIMQTGETSFHFVDEAAPPNLLKEIAQEILDRNLIISYWTNVRFDSAFDLSTTKLLAKSGCIAVSGGLEVASERILKLINKGVSVKSAIKVIESFANANILVHTYLMYGFPSQTLNETIESLDIVRNLFNSDLIQSAFWHQFAMTIHSETGKNPQKFGVELIQKTKNPFANNAVDYLDSQLNYDLKKIGLGLKVATQNYMEGIGFDLPLKAWFK